MTYTTKPIGTYTDEWRRQEIEKMLERLKLPRMDLLEDRMNMLEERVDAELTRIKRLQERVRKVEKVIDGTSET